MMARIQRMKRTKSSLRILTTNDDDDNIPSSQRSTITESAFKKPEIIVKGMDPYDGQDTEDEEEEVLIADFD